MTGRTHDLAGFTLLNVVLATQPILPMTVATAVVAFGANFLGAAAPDLDEPTSGFWQRMPAGSIVSRIVGPLLGSHRLISHSLVGMALIGWLFMYLLGVVRSVLLVDITVVWWAFMIGYASHLLTDSLTTEGVPWLFPIPIRFGFPPIKVLRIKTGGIIEKSFVFPGLLLLNGYLVYANYPKYIDFFQSFIK